MNNNLTMLLELIPENKASSLLLNMQGYFESELARIRLDIEHHRKKTANLYNPDSRASVSESIPSLKKIEVDSLIERVLIDVLVATTSDDCSRSKALSCYLSVSERCSDVIRVELISLFFEDSGRKALRQLSNMAESSLALSINRVNLNCK
ncbi:hypothetical protein LMH73_019660 [Vibrio splendidus]|nr:hypothetical protein [Vibrio splendidus]MCC4882467.1 hypothetical protein [Vibrio splendidus]